MAWAIFDRWRAFRVAWRMGSPLALLGACWVAGLRLNLTGSLPVGLYLVSRAAPVRAAIVLTCLPHEVTGAPTGVHPRTWRRRGSSGPSDWQECQSRTEASGMRIAGPG